MPASTYPLRLPAYLMEQAKQVAEASGSSLNQFFLAAIAEKVGEVRATLQERAARADVGKARAVLDRVPDEPPTPGDER
jgi:uncharacterized protein (DUF1778 family)